MRSVSLILLSIILLCRCTPRYHIPMVKNMPLISEQGDFDHTTSFNKNNIASSIAFVPVNNLGIQVNGFYHGRRSDEDLLAVQEPDFYSRNWLIEGGIGYCKAVSEQLVVEIYGIGGYGAVGASRTREFKLHSSDYVTADKYLFAIQPAFGVKLKHFTAGFSFRWQQNNFTNIQGDYIYSDENQNNYLNNNKLFYTFEPAITLRGGSEYLKGQLQFGSSFNITNTAFNQSMFNVYLGLNVNTNFFVKRSKK